jgi:hypothetical protein
MLNNYMKVAKDKNIWEIKMKNSKLNRLNIGIVKG